jgi:hypothetical protein
MLALAVVASLGTVTGCGSKDTGKTNVKLEAQSPEETQKKIADVRNNPNIPAAQKEAIIARIQSGAGTAAAQSQGQGQGK